MHLLDEMTEDRAEADAKLLEDAARRDPAELTFAPLSEAVGNTAREQEYVQKERLFFSLARRLEATAPERYYRRLNEIWNAAEERIASASEVLAKSPVARETLLLRYYAARAHHDYENARQATRQLADYLLKKAMDAKYPNVAEAVWLRYYATTILQQGRRAEAYPLLDAYARFCVARETPAEAKKYLLSMGRLALRAGVPMPIARGLSKYKERRGPLTRDERLLLGNLYYVAGRNKKAFNEFRAVEPDMPFGNRHKWLLIAMLTSLLRTDRLEEAEAVMAQLMTDYPDAAELDEARFRFGEYYFRERDLGRARSNFENLLRTSPSEAYAKMCAEYLKRIAHLEDIKRRKDK